MKLTILGTGNAKVTECYNTCFVLTEGESHFLVDGGGGNGILRQLKSAGIDWTDIKTIFVTHKHIDHVMGIVWMIRMIGQGMKEGRLNYGNAWAGRRAACCFHTIVCRKTAIGSFSAYVSSYRENFHKKNQKISCKLDKNIVDQRSKNVVMFT